MKRRHDYWTCRDKECQRPLCVAYKQGYDDGREDEREAADDGA